jgi:hopene-associated glycosyltransferase HpnB
MPVAFTILSLLALLGWLYLLGGHGWFWQTDQRLPRVSSAPSPWPSVTVVVPARDEAVMLPETLPSLLTQDYQGELTVVLVDDQSGDGTAGIARALADGLPEAHELLIVEGTEPPPGWAGKVWAMAQGTEVAAARTAGGHTVGPPPYAGGDRPPSPAAGSSPWAPERAPAGGVTESGRWAAGRPPAIQPGYVLFTDADVAHAPGSVSALVAAAEAERLDLVSQMALLRTRNPWERRIVPAFVYFFAMLYPFSRVNRPGGRTAAAAGGCMLVRGQALADAGGLERIRGARIDDVALGQLLGRRPGGRIWLGFGERVASRRPYPGLADLWNMVARSAYTQLRYSPWLLAATIAGLLLLFAVPPVAGIGGLIALASGAGIESRAGLIALIGLGAWAAMSATWVPILRLYRLSPLRAPGLPLVAMLYTAMTVDSARRHAAGKGGLWKGRPLPRPQAMA